ncbi:hypothetical protein BUALT_Bualt02G0147700 [Buddleja alternifolia]|uniref:Glucose/Sorbosone dehydrogenase domain-containing protein n=1 Tax=Buddleja alternifolia TaxID=168488 RepID=A0AAV6Y1U6_9LAMI|nr:hypothetical protein BUALT_Bualt02G0147700 [Buddleja alternifolia]
MGSFHFMILLVFLMLIHFLDPYSAMPLCTDSRAPFTPKSPLQFCPYNYTTCCKDSDDLKLKKQFESMKIPDSACASLLKSILCAKCDPFSSELFRVDSISREVPVLCNSVIASNSTRSNQPSNDFCSEVWNTCRNIYMSSSPFTTQAAVQANSNSTKLTDLWKSLADFSDAFCGASDPGLPCYNGAPVTQTNNTATPDHPTGICLEKIGNGSYFNMVAHPDGSGRAFFSNQQGRIWLAMVPEEDSRGMLDLDEADPFLDLSDEAFFDTRFGLMGFAFHPNFIENGRFFVSFSCDKAKWPNCVGRCACNSDVDCDPSKLSRDGGVRPCQYQSVIAEFSVNGTASKPSLATSANPSEIRRIFTMGIPFASHQGAQIVFGPKDGYLYFMMGDGGGGDPYNLAQNKKSLIGKIMRFDVDNILSGNEVDELGLWGNYSIPKDNPYNEDKELEKEIWALGLRNPWRCSFDSARPSYFICSDAGQDQYEEVNLISKGGNYGWRVYEGPYVYTPPHSPGGNTSLDSIRPIFPVMGYHHSEVDSREGSASITGGYFYRSMTDPCLHGRYLFSDLYAGSIWAGIENPINSGNFTSSKIPFNCAHNSPLNCAFTPGISRPDMSMVFSFGEDNNKDVFILTNSGVYRIVRPSRCNYVCAKENASSVESRQGASSSRPISKASLFKGPYEILAGVFISVLCLFFSLPGRTRRETKLRSLDELQSGLRRSKRETRNGFNYRLYEMSESDSESMKAEKSNALSEHSNASYNADFSTDSQDSEEIINKQEMQVNQPTEHPEMVD